MDICIKAGWLVLGRERAPRGLGYPRVMKTRIMAFAALGHCRYEQLPA